MIPVVYSFRRCPYAIRARMALAYAAVTLEMREVVLSSKPQSMLLASAKGTVPILVLPDGSVIDESTDIMRWALAQKDPDHWWRETLEAETLSLVDENDGVFKAHLDHYKYADRYPQQPQSYYRAQGGKFLLQLEQKLGRRHYLLSDRITFSDVAIFPFVRQFAFVDKPWFDQAPYPNLQRWLQSFLDSSLFSCVMTKLPVWREGAAPLVFPAT